MSNKMNDIIRILTIISTILMPLTFIAGLYGMNFNVSDSPWNMPELHHPYGYPITLLLMLAIALGMIWFFKRKTALKSDRHFYTGKTFLFEHIFFESAVPLLEATGHKHLTFDFLRKIKTL